MEYPGMSLSEQFRLKRQRGRVWIHKIGTIQVAQAGVFMIQGIVTLIYGVANPTFVYYVGCPIWPGLVLLVAGILGILAGRETDLPESVINPYQRKLILANYVITVVSLTPALLTTIYAGMALAWCESNNEYQQSCIYHKSENEVIAITNIITGSVACITSVPFMVSYCVFARAFGLRVNSALAEPDPIMQEQMSHQAQIIEQQQAEIARLADRQQAVEKQLASAGSFPHDDPPPYDEPITEKS